MEFAPSLVRSVSQVIASLRTRASKSPALPGINRKADRLGRHSIRAALGQRQQAPGDHYTPIAF
jgi:hypothetical protein